MGLSTYKENGYNYARVAVFVDSLGQLEYKVGTKKTLERKQYNGELPLFFEILTFSQAVAKYPEYFTL